MRIIIAMMFIIFIIISTGCIENLEYGFIPMEEHSEKDLGDSIDIKYDIVPSKTSTTERLSIFFYFYENYTGCSVEGNVSINGNDMGETEDSAMEISLSQFSSVASFGEQNEICIKGEVTGCDGVYNGWKVMRCWWLNMTENFFSLNNRDRVSFRTQVDIHKPANYWECSNFVRPQDVKDFIEHKRDIGLFENDVLEDMDTIWEYVDSHISYRYDSDTAGEEYWKLPNETMQGWGDCEEWANLFVSMARAYNNSLECYSIGMPGHVGAFCKISSDEAYVYGFYDQHIRIRKFFVSGSSDEKQKLEDALESYFREYEMPSDNRKITSAFNENTSLSFEDSEEFVEWAMEIPTA